LFKKGERKKEEKKKIKRGTGPFKSASSLKKFGDKRKVWRVNQTHSTRPENTRKAQTEGYPQSTSEFPVNVNISAPKSLEFAHITTHKRA
jgi:hypothetical protein